MIFFVVDVEDGVFGCVGFVSFFVFCFSFVVGVSGSIKRILLMFPLCLSLRRLQWCWQPQLQAGCVGPRRATWAGRPRPMCHAVLPGWHDERHACALRRPH